MGKATTTTKGQKEESVLLQSLIFAVYGFAANLTFMLVSSPAGVLHLLHGYDSGTWGAILGITAADISMCALFKHLGALTYNFSRALATVLIGIATMFLESRKVLSLQFVVG